LEKLPCGRDRPIRKPAAPAALGEWRRRLESFLSENGLRRSDQRFQIVETILEKGGHFSAQELIDAVRSRNPEIGPATVYRNIKLLCDAGLLIETLTDHEGRTFYEFSSDDHHDHIVCLDCNAIFEFHEPKIEAIQSKMCSDSDFRISGHRHVLFAHCNRL
jgi:Fur family ferric uptake transcriptional regulator